MDGKISGPLLLTNGCTGTAAATCSSSSTSSLNSFAAASSTTTTTTTAKAVASSSSSSSMRRLPSLNYKNIHSIYLNYLKRSNSEAKAFLARSGKVIIRMRGLPFESNAKDVIEFFERGENKCDVLDGEQGVLFVHYPDGRATGDAFVMLRTEEEASKALLKHKELIGPRYIELFKSTIIEVQQVLKRSQDPKFLQNLNTFHHQNSINVNNNNNNNNNNISNMNHHYINFNHIHHGGSGGGKEMLLTPTNGSNSSYFSMTPLPILPPEMITGGNRKDCIRMRNLPLDCSVEQILEFLGVHSQHIVQQGVHMIYNAQGKPSGEAFIQMDSEQASVNVTNYKNNKYMLLNGKKCLIEVIQCSGEEMNLVLMGILPSNLLGMQATPLPLPLPLPPPPPLPSYQFMQQQQQQQQQHHLHQYNSTSIANNNTNTQQVSTVVYMASKPPTMQLQAPPPPLPSLPPPSYINGMMSTSAAGVATNGQLIYGNSLNTAAYVGPFNNSPIQQHQSTLNPRTAASATTTTYSTYAAVAPPPPPLIYWYPTPPVSPTSAAFLQQQQQQQQQQQTILHMPTSTAAVIAAASQPCLVIVKNLPPNVSINDLIQFFHGYGELLPEYIYIQPSQKQDAGSQQTTTTPSNSSSSNTNDAFVTFFNRYEAERVVIEKNHQKIGNNPVELFLHFY